MEVKEELEKQEGKKIEMAEVLARFKVLEEEQERFKEKKTEVEKQLRQINNLYVKVRDLAPSIDP